ncbi:hypothetical protein BDZ97DRAFT_1752906 [Flammula alnicola]|nr:hypothetical protein BDZ97DRAFT_1752906 [Flammula alnicola]
MSFILLNEHGMRDAYSTTTLECLFKLAITINRKNGLFKKAYELGVQAPYHPHRKKGGPPGCYSLDELRIIVLRFFISRMESGMSIKVFDLSTLFTDLFATDLQFVDKVKGLRVLWREKFTTFNFTDNAEITE